MRDTRFRRDSLLHRVADENTRYVELGIRFLFHERTRQDSTTKDVLFCVLRTLLHGLTGLDIESNVPSGRRWSLATFLQNVFASTLIY